MPTTLVVRRNVSTSPRRRSPSPNLYGGRRSLNLYEGPRRRSPNLYGVPRKRLNRMQIRRIVSIIVSIMIALALARVSNRMSAADSRKYASYILNIFKRFLSVIKYFVGYEKYIEAGATAIVAILSRKITSGNYRFTTTNFVVGVTAYTLASRSGTGISNLINQMNKVSNSIWQLPGTQAALNEKIRKALITMLAWLISSLNVFAVSNVGDMIKSELRRRGIMGPSRRNLENAGRRALRIN